MAIAIVACGFWRLSAQVETATPTPSDQPLRSVLLATGVTIRVVTASPTPLDQPLRPELLAATVTISGPKGAGTGFICNYRGKTYVATNQHVLEVGGPLAVKTSTNDSLPVQYIFTAADEDLILLQCLSIPSTIKPLEIATLPDASIQRGNRLIIPGNSKGDGVITQTSGKLLALGPQRIEVDNPVYPGNSGSPIIDVASSKVIGVLTFAKLMTFDQFERESFRSKNSSIKSAIRYFGYRIDAVRKWEALNWQLFQQNEQLIEKSQDELYDILAYLAGSPSQDTDFEDLQAARNDAAAVLNDRRQSAEDRNEAHERLLRDIETLARRAKSRLDNRKIYFCQQVDADMISRMADAVAAGTKAAERDGGLGVTLLPGGY